MIPANVQRARKPEHKEARAKEILACAEALVETGGFSSFTMADLAGRVGLAKGTLFLYFPTKEALGLALLERLLGTWFDDVDGWLEKARRPLTPRAISRAVSATTHTSEALVGLLTLLGSLFEHNVDEATAARFKRWLLSRLTLTGALLEKAAPWIPDGAGVRFLVQLHALAVGLHYHAHPSPVVARVLEAEDLAPLRIDFARELELASRALLEGIKTGDDHG